jgi:hypothetical protein
MESVVSTEIIDAMLPADAGEHWVALQPGDSCLVIQCTGALDGKSHCMPAPGM